MNRSTKRFSIILLMIFIVLLFNTTTYAYWASNVLGSNQNSNQSLSIGEWDYVTSLPAGVVLYVSGNTYSESIVVYHEGNFFITTKQTSSNDYPGKGTPYNAPFFQLSLEYKGFNYYVLNNVVYHEQTEAYYIAKPHNPNGYQPNTNSTWHRLGTIDYDQYMHFPVNSIARHNNQYYLRIVADNDHGVEPNFSNSAQWRALENQHLWKPVIYPTTHTYVLHNGSVYRNQWYASASNVPGAHNVWELISSNPLWNASETYQVGQIVKDEDDHFYRLLDASLASTKPGEVKGAWQRVDTLDYIENNNYKIHEIVIYQNKVYQVVNETNANNSLPGAIKNAWNQLDTLNYVETNSYELHDVVIIDDAVYQVVDAERANQNAPGDAQNAWNRLGIIDYQWYNVYKQDSVVFYNHTAYRALTEVTNVIPGTDSTKWQSLT